MSQVVTRGMGAILKAVSAAVRLVASEEVMPCFVKVSHQRKKDNVLFQEAYTSALQALSKKLQSIINVPVLSSDLNTEARLAIWQSGQDGLWCVNPIDNHSNFLRGLPFFAVSAALLRQGKAVLSVVYDPVADDLFAAEHGKGAFLNGGRLQVHEVASSLSSALASIDMQLLDSQLCVQLNNHAPYAAQRNFGTSALEWCYTAAGRYDVYLHGGQSLWDYAAGCLILQESGGFVAELIQDDFTQGDVWQRSVIAARGEHLFHEWKSWLRTALAI